MAKTKFPKKFEYLGRQIELVVSYDPTEDPGFRKRVLVFIDGEKLSDYPSLEIATNWAKSHCDGNPPRLESPLQHKVDALRALIDACPYTPTYVNLHFDHRFNVITLMGDGMLVLKVVVALDGGSLKMVACGNRGGQENTPRNPAYNTMCGASGSVISWEQFTQFCLNYKEAWQPGK